MQRGCLDQAPGRHLRLLSALSPPLLCIWYSWHRPSHLVHLLPLAWGPLHCCHYSVPTSQGFPFLLGLWCPEVSTQCHPGPHRALFRMRVKGQFANRKHFLYLFHLLRPTQTARCPLCGPLWPKVPQWCKILFRDLLAPCCLLGAGRLKGLVYQKCPSSFFCQLVSF